MSETVERNNRFYEQANGEILTENEQLKEWLIVANKEIERLNNKLDKLGLLDKDIEKETKTVNLTVTLPKWLRDIARENKVNFSKILQKSLYEVLNIGGSISNE